MSKAEELKQTYMKDIETMASKSRFGYFSIPPSHAAGDTCFEQKKGRFYVMASAAKDSNGRVKVQDRNIFSGLTASGVLKKSNFSCFPSYSKGDTYIDPGKA
eukprot:GHVR01169539.1.p1 GENE.GHVR01169539.1~~GHVR01169539.1.p1  ORF type:complete len:102 (-),score=6.69 GHVR01169539.1:45-350(-)